MALILAALCILSAIDRGGLPPMAVLGRQPGGSAAIAAGRADLADVAFDRAVIRAERAIADSPVDASGASLLALAAFSQNEPERGDAAFRVAAQLGWRDEATQLYWLAVAQQTADPARGAQRLDALLRLGVRSPAALNALQALEASPAGRDAVADRLAFNPAWASTRLFDFGALESDALARRTDTIKRAAERGMSIDCGTLARGVSRMFAQERYRESANLWTTLCATRALDGLANGDFEQPIERPAPVPFLWSVQSSGGTEVIQAAPDGRQGSQALVLTAPPLTASLVATQALVLSPGSYRIEWRARPAAGGTRGLHIRLRCLSRDGSSTVASGEAVGSAARNSVIATIANADCNAQQLDILAPGRRSAGSARLWIDDIRILPRS